MKDVSIIIVNYNTCKITLNCIQSIFEQTKGVDFEVIVVDNASTDGSREALHKETHRIKLIESPQNIGFAKANNLGALTAQCKYLFLLNSDTVLLNNAAGIFYDFLESATSVDIACIGTRMVGEDGVSENLSYGEFKSIGSTLRFFWGLVTRRKVGRMKIEGPLPARVDFVSGADLFIRKDVADRLGLFDPDFFMYCEDVELQYRYSQAGYKSMIIDGPRIVHLESRSSGFTPKAVTLDYWDLYMDSLYKLMRKRYSLFKYLIFRVIALGYIPALIKYCKSPRELPRLLRIVLR